MVPAVQPTSQSHLGHGDDAFGDPAYPLGEQAKVTAMRSYRRGDSFTPLPASRNEVENICALYPNRAIQFLGVQATEEEAKKLGKGLARIHFACHGVINQRFPLDSGLVLSIPDLFEEGNENGFCQA